MTRRRKKKIKE